VTARKVPGTLPVSFRYTPGVGTTSFLEALRDRGVLLGSRCAHCEVTYVPCRTFCERCFTELTPDVECGPGGALASWTIGEIGVDEEPLEEPVMLGLVRLDGADTLLLHRLVGVDAPAIGMTVRAILAEERVGSILDLEGFGPA
jgi:uncharacterized OB-fold protein